MFFIKSKFSPRRKHIFTTEDIMFNRKCLKAESPLRCKQIDRETDTCIWLKYHPKCADCVAK